ncbi:MAG: hypothetical protein V4474_03705 [Patescibacteria group bacterium]
MAHIDTTGYDKIVITEPARHAVALMASIPMVDGKLIGETKPVSGKSIAEIAKELRGWN